MNEKSGSTIETAASIVKREREEIERLEMRLAGSRYTAWSEGRRAWSDVPRSRSPLTEEGRRRWRRSEGIDRTARGSRAGEKTSCRSFARGRRRLQRVERVALYSRRGLGRDEAVALLRSRSEEFEHSLSRERARRGAVDPRR